MSFTVEQVEVASRGYQSLKDELESDELSKYRPSQKHGGSQGDYMGKKSEADGTQDHDAEKGVWNDFLVLSG